MLDLISFNDIPNVLIKKRYVTVEEMDKMEEKQRNFPMFFQFNNSAIQSNVFHWDSERFSWKRTSTDIVKFSNHH